MKFNKRKFRFLCETFNPKLPVLSPPYLSGKGPAGKRLQLSLQLSRLIDNLPVNPESRDSREAGSRQGRLMNYD
jgi:hypothetical protein